MAAVGSEGSSKTGFAIVTTAEETENHKKTKDCKKWEQEKVTGLWKCMKPFENEAIKKTTN